MEENEEQRHSNKVLLFRLAVTNSFKNIAESVRILQERNLSATKKIEDRRSKSCTDFSVENNFFPDTEDHRRRMKTRNSGRSYMYSEAYSISEEAFRDILTILKSKPSTAQKLHKAMFKELYDNMTNDLEDILKEGSLQSGLERLAKLIDENSSVAEDAWRPPGNVSLHLRSLDAQKIKEESELLEKRVNEMEEENATLIEKIAEKRSKIMAMDDSIMRSLRSSPIALDLLEQRLEGLEKCLTLLDHE